MELVIIMAVSAGMAVCSAPMTMSIGFGSRKQELVDRMHDPSGIFEKIRIIIRHLPPIFYPKDFNLRTHMGFMKTGLISLSPLYQPRAGRCPRRTAAPSQV